MRSTISLEPIAIIGIGCRFPGANNPEAFWRLLCDGVEAISEIPNSRWDVEKFYDPDPAKLGKAHTRRGGFLENIDRFDPQFFGISPREANTIDPQHRLLLEVAWEALEDGGQIPAQLAGTQTGVFIGIGTHDYSIMLWQHPVSEPYATTGTGNCIAANRLSYVFDFKGPSLAVDTACSSSLVAVHLACQSIWNGESSMALAGGVNVLLLPTIMVGFSKGGFLSGDGRCKSFDAQANGYVRSEGAGIVVLKPLSQAQADGDSIYAVIRGSAVNQDGWTNGMAAPNPKAQEAVIKEACRKAGISPGQIQYVEAHGTGTKLGDPIEMQALGAALAEGRPPGDYCRVGSVKTNIGHAETAAGVAGLIKVALALKHQQIPPSLHFKQPNPAIAFDKLPLRVQTTLSPFPTGSHYVGVNSFGFGGTNAHLVLEGRRQEADGRRFDEGRGQRADGRRFDEGRWQEADGRREGEEEVALNLERPFNILTLSAKSEKALQELAQRYVAFLETHSEISLADICFTANTKRSQFNYRLAVVTKSTEQLRSQLQAFASGRETTGSIAGQVKGDSISKIAFLFTGQGSQYVGMGRELYETQPIFRNAIDKCAAILEPYLDKPLVEVLYPPLENSLYLRVTASPRPPLTPSPSHLIDETVYTQPALFSLEYALYQLWKAWGIEPSVVMGHSVGEYVAACVAEVFSLEDGLKLIAARGRLMQSLPKDGAMVAVFADEEKLSNAIKPYQKDVAIAAFNGTQNIVISGKKEAIENIVAQLEIEGIETKPLTVSHAFHSPLMEPILAEFQKIARQINYSTPTIELISNLTGESVNEEIASAQYWCNHIRQPVKFAQSMETLFQLGYQTFIEIGAKPTLIGMIRSSFNSELFLPSLRQGCSDWQQLLQSLSELYVRRVKVDWSNCNSSGNLVHLPTYPFQRQRYWWEEVSNQLPPFSVNEFIERGLASSVNSYQENQLSSHPLLGQRLHLPGTQEIRFQAQISQDLPAYLKDHCIGSQPIFPATAYLEIALAAGATLFKSHHLVVVDFAIAQPLVLCESESKTLQIILKQNDNLAYSFEIFSFNSTEKEPSYLLHATGILKLEAKNNSLFQLELTQLQAKFTQNSFSVLDYYQRLQKQGLCYGEKFQGIKEIWQLPEEALGKIKLPESLDADNYQFHPVLLDSCLQLLGAAFAENNENGTYLPVGLERLQIYQKVPNCLWSYVKVEKYNDLNGASDRQKIKVDLQVLDENGFVVAQIEGLSLQYISHQSLQKFVPKSKQKHIEDWLYKVVWKQKERSQELEVRSQEKVENCLIFADKKGLGLELAKGLEEKDDRIHLIFPGESFAISNEGHYYINPNKLEDFQQLLTEINPQKIIHLWGLEENIALETAQKLGCGSVLNLVQALAKIQSSKLWLVTKGTQPVETSSLQIQQSTLWGLGRVIRLENPDLPCVCIDLDPTQETNNVERLLEEITREDTEDQIAYRRGIRYVPRLTRRTAQSQTSQAISPTPIRLYTTEYGVLDNLALAPATRRPPAPGEVEIQVGAAGVNFRDILNALGMIKAYFEQIGSSETVDDFFGGECAGRIAAVGEGVTGFRVGDEVIAAQALGSLSSFVCVDARFVVPKPKKLSFTEAATIPTTFLTAYYGLHHLAKIKAGDRILIHAAAGGVGQAAIQIAQQAGAEVFATASPQKWDFLKSMGIKHVMNSRTLDFAEEIMTVTEGKGVNIVLNSLNGEFIAKNFEILASNGCFIEIGKIGIWNESQVKAKRADVTYCPFDLLELSRKDPNLIALLFAQVMPAFQKGDLKPLPNTVFPIEEAANAFRYMAQAKHIGKVVITLPEIASQPFAIREDGSYLITGGLGALGLQMARWLVEQGAKHLILVGRSNPSQAAKDAIAQLETAGAKVTVVQADVSNLEDVEKIISHSPPPRVPASSLSPLSPSSPLPLRGIIHAAGILDDGVLLKQTWEQFDRVMAPKVQGAWNLHLATQHLPLDFFVCFSSIASLLGSPGQGNYAAANAFMDALAHYRRSLGLPGLSVNWGIWADVGMAAELSERDKERLSQQGLEAISLPQGTQILETLLQQQATQVGAFPVNWATFLKGSNKPFFEAVIPQAEIQETPQLNSEFLQELEEIENGDRKTLLFTRVRTLVAKVLGFDSPEYIEPQQNFGDLGMDSLMAVELKNALQATLGIQVPLTSAFDHPTVELLTEYLSQELSTIKFAPTLMVEKKEVSPATHNGDRKVDVYPTPIKEKREIAPEFYQFRLMPEYVNLQKDLERVKQLGNPFFKVYDGIAKNTIQSGDRELINYSSYNYLGMSGDPIVSGAAQNAIALYGTSVCASRVVSGERSLHQELEREIADFLGTEDCIVYIGGHPTNVTTIGHLFGSNDLIVCDALSHNSVKEGCKLSGATIIDFPHNDWQTLDNILSQRRHEYEKVLITIEGVYSTDGDLAPLPEVIEIKKRYKVFLMVDEAHSIGVLGATGRGIGEHFGVNPADVDLWMGTLSKSFASCGGYIAGCRELVEYLKYTAPGFVFSVGMSPPNTAAALAAIRLLRAEPERVAIVQQRAKLFLKLSQSRGLDTGMSQDSPVIPIIIGEPYKAVQLSHALNEQGINVHPMVYPSVPYNASRLRFFISCTHTEEQIRYTVDAIARSVISNQ